MRIFSQLIFLSLITLSPTDGLIGQVSIFLESGLHQPTSDKMHQDFRLYAFQPNTEAIPEAQLSRNGAWELIMTLLENGISLSAISSVIIVNKSAPMMEKYLLQKMIIF